MSKASRQKTILSIINQTRVETQQELTNILTNMGYKVTQATISRDIKELGLVKETYQGRTSYAEPLDPRLEKMVSIFKQSVTSIDYSGNMIAIKTIEGSANASAALIDYIANPEILGAVAGDDTIMVLVKNIDAVQRIVEMLKKYMHHR